MHGMCHQVPRSCPTWMLEWSSYCHVGNTAPGTSTLRCLHGVGRGHPEWRESAMAPFGRCLLIILLYLIPRKITVPEPFPSTRDFIFVSPLAPDAVAVGYRSCPSVLSPPLLSCRDTGCYTSPQLWKERHETPGPEYKMSI